MGKHTPAVQQGRLVAQWRGTDQSMAAFARQHGVAQATFAAWVARHRPAPPAATEAHRFVQVAAPLVPATPAFSVCVGGLALHFDTPPPAVWFAAVVQALAPC